MGDKSHIVVEEGTIDDIPAPELLVGERDPNPPPKPVPLLPKGLIVVPTEGVTDQCDSG